LSITQSEGSGKCIQGIHGRGNPICESAVTVLGLVEHGDLLSEDGEDSLGGVTGLKAGKEPMRGQVYLGLAFVGSQCKSNRTGNERLGVSDVGFL
jgi:hypothetical protein